MSAPFGGPSDACLASDQSAGVTQVWMRDYSSAQCVCNLTRGEGTALRGAPGGNAVYFWRSGAPSDTLMRACIDRAPTGVVHEPGIVATITASSVTNWDLHPDGRRFVVAVSHEGSNSVGGGDTQRDLILENWFGELRRRMASKTL